MQGGQEREREWGKGVEKEMVWEREWAVMMQKTATWEDPMRVRSVVGASKLVVLGTVTMMVEVVVVLVRGGRLTGIVKQLVGEV